MEPGSDDRDLIHPKASSPPKTDADVAPFIFRRLALHRLRKSKSLSGSCTKREIISKPRGSEFSERRLAI
jgi:hypothetical protein